MTRSKKIFAGFAVAFFAMLVFIVVDVSRRTTFPGSKRRLKETFKDSSAATADTLKRTLTPKSAAHQP